MDIDYSPLGWLHAVLATLALIAGAWALVRPKGTPRHRLIGRVYAVSLAATCVTSLGMYELGRWFFPHTLAVVTLGLVAAGWLAGRGAYRARWRLHAHLSCMIVSYYMLIGGAVNEAFLHVHALQALSPNVMQSPLLGMVHTAVMAVFAVWLIAANVGALRRRTPRTPAAASDE
jgi:uncharacterized membrane protein